MSNQGFDGTTPQQPGPRRGYPTPEEAAQWQEPDPAPTEPISPVPQRGYADDAPPPPVDPAGPPYEEDPSRLPLILGIIVLLAVAALIAWLVLRDGGSDTAEPAPPPTTVATTPVEAPATPTETAEEPTPTVTETTTVAAPETTAAEVTTPAEEPTETETAVEEPTEAPTEEPTEVAVEIQPLTAEDLPQELAGYVLGDDLTYEGDDHVILVSDLGIAEMDPAWQEMTFPDAEEVADNASCSTFDDGAQACFILSANYGVISTSGDPDVDITEFVQALAEHLR